MTLPAYHFRHRATGATVLRVTAGARLDLEPIATVVRRTGAIKPRGERALSPEDTAAIAAWLARPATTESVADRALDAIGAAAHWAQGPATDTEVAAASDALLLALHDLRAVLVRRLAEPKGRG